MNRPGPEKHAPWAPIVFCALGFLALVLQTLLFRDFFAVYEGHELGLAAFFSSWLVWVGLGALCARRLPLR